MIPPSRFSKFENFSCHVLTKLFSKKTIFEMAIWLIIFGNLKFQDASKVAIFRPPNSYHPNIANSELNGHL